MDAVARDESNGISRFAKFSNKKQTFFFFFWKKLQAQIFNLFVVVDRKLTGLLEVLHTKLEKEKFSEFNSRDDELV